MATLLFYLGFATLITHEMDAVAQSEWRLLFIFRKLPEDIASTAFIAIHVPLLALLISITANGSSWQNYTRGAVMIFLIVHAGLHARLQQHPHYTFHSALSKSLIYGGGILGFLYLISVYWR